MKKGIISLLLCLLMVMMLFAGCAQGNKTEETEAPKETTEESTEATEAEEEAEEAETTEEPTESETEEPETTEKPTEPPTEAPTEAPATYVTSALTTQPTTTAPPAQAAAPVDLYTLALGCVGSPVSTLYATVGYPNYSTYGQSCMGEGEDGQLFYDGFEVNTFRSDTVPEYVTAVWPD